MYIIFFSVFYFITTIIIAHFFMPPEYHWTQNTISDLAAQGLPHRQIMQVGFIGFGILLTIGIIAKSVAAKKIFYPDILIILYGLSVMLSGFFSAKPFIEGVAYSVQQDGFHSFFAQAAGLFFSVGIFLYLIASPDPRQKLIHAVFFVLVIGTSAIFGLDESGIINLGKGVIQRMLYLVSFIWLIISQFGINGRF